MPLDPPPGSIRSHRSVNRRPSSRHPQPRAWLPRHSSSSNTAYRLPDQRSLAEFEKMVLGALLSAQLQEELKRTIAVRNMPSVTTEGSIRRVLDQVPGGIRNVALYDRILLSGDAL